MVTTVTVVPGIRSLISRAASMPHLSSGLMMAGTPSRIRVLVTGSIRTSVVSGTCLMQTTIFIFRVPPYSEPAMTMRWTSLVPS